METAAVPGAFSDQSESLLTTTAPSHDEEPRHATAVNPKSIVMNIALATNPPFTSSDVKDSRSALPPTKEDAPDIQSPRLRSSRTWKVRGTDLTCEKQEPKRPLSLLDLPVDILKEIVREITHTNDLTSLALCHSALHRLTIPHIYSRFDIVWPDTSTHAEPRSGVDALTYGLATLVMAEEVFGDYSQRQSDGNRFMPNGKGHASDTIVRRRRGNHYAQYTKKFSLGNGPADWVSEYLISKEGGKMLGTLVALAVARMRSLETFVWDMPTGVLRDVWLALSSLADHEEVRPCRLQKVWMRWHDNTPADAAQQPPPPPPPYVAVPVPSLQPSGSVNTRRVRPEDLDHVEHPSFSILPALRSLSVLDIDELAYLDEMAVLMARSVDKLRELRVGIARHATSKQWVSVWEDEDLPQIDHDQPTASSLTIGERRCGGVLGVLTGLVHDLRKQKPATPHRRRSSPVKINRPLTRTMSAASVSSPSPSFTVPSPQNLTLPIRSTDANLAAAAADDPLIASSRAASPQPAALSDESAIADTSEVTPRLSSMETCREETENPVQDELLQDKLQLEILELERVPLCIDALQNALDWSKLTCLTLLNCHNHEILWKTLRRTFSPVPRSTSAAAGRRPSSVSPRKNSKSSMLAADIEMSYPLNLKRIHTNTVSPALISFLKETLAPNSLEVLFLQEVRNYAPSVTIEAIFKGPLRRHRASLRKVLIDSSEKSPDGLPATSNRWRRWMLNREILTFLCSGKMPRLRELGMAIEYRDWHFFLQHLPSIPHLRSIYIPYLADHVHGADVDPRELALQIVDIIALRPEVELCYMGIANKCFEVLENKTGWDGRPESHLNTTHDSNANDVDEEEDTDDAIVDDDEADEDADDDEADDDTESENSEDDGDSDIVESNSRARLRLREILFYDDKVAVFRARHGRL